ncbi:MAG: GDSL-type esterase/lipase family protein [Thermoanaerobaculia bacterium]|nr:GDSL-type esterase/lipase family protein [Thermoanaerobaculia bacterium]
MRSRAAWLFAAALLASPLSATEQWVAIGDSITAGIGDDTPVPSGYPMRLEKMLKSAGRDVVVTNLGVPGETSGEGLARVNAALAGAPDGLLIQYGANDIPLIEAGLISPETLLDNIDRIARTASARGTVPVLATLLPRNTRIGADPDNLISIHLVFDLRDLAVMTNRRLVDIWEGFDIANDPDSFDTLYAGIPRDPVGHPNAEGYDRIAELYRDVILGLDTVKPVPGPFSPSFGTTAVPRGQLFVASVIEPPGASGVELREAWLLLNGKPVAEPDESFSNRRRVVFFFRKTKAVGCRAELGVRAFDRAEPPNEIRRTLRIFDVKDRRVFVGDVDYDCRVDGYDLTQLARAFGAERGDPRYQLRYDFDRNGRIEKKDRDTLLANFGKESD